MVENDCAVCLNSRHGFRDYFGALPGREIVRFQDETLETTSQEFFREVEIVDAAFDNIRGDVNLKIIAAINGFPCAIGRGLASNSGGCGTQFFLLGNIGV
jgi:hypothetical protein